MKKWAKISLITLFTAGIVCTSGHFIGVEIANNIRLNNITSTFVEKLEKTNCYKAKHLNLDFFDQETSHHFSLKFTDFELKIGVNDTYDFKGELKFYYDYLEIYSGSAVFLDEIFYLETHESMLIDDNFSFSAESLKSFRESFNSSTLLDTKIFDFSFNLNIFDDFDQNIKEIKTKDPNEFLFEIPLNKYNSTVLFYTDADCQLRKMKTLTAIELENTLLSMDASNIEFSDYIIIKKPDLKYESLTSLLDGANDILQKFNKETGKGISLALGNSTLNQPLSIYREDDLIASLLGELNIYNKTNNEDFLINYKGNLEFYIIDEPLPDVTVDITLTDDVFYISFGDLTKGSLKMSTIEQIFEINKDELISQIKSLIFNIVDLIGINYSFNEDYRFIRSIDVVEERITTTLSIPVTNEEETNTDFSFEITTKNSKFESFTFGEISYENYKISNLSMSINGELPEKPIINKEDYRSYDEIIKNLINFN